MGGNGVPISAGFSVRESWDIRRASEQTGELTVGAVAVAVIVVVILRIQVSWRHLPMDNGSTASTVPLSASRAYDNPMNYAA